MLPFRHTLIALALCGGMGATPVFAEGTPPVAQPKPSAAEQPPLPASVNPGQLPRPNANPLNLNAAQQKALADLRKEQMANQQKINALQRQLMDLSYSDNYDKSKAADLIEAIAKATEADLAAHAKQANAFYISLTPEQKRQFKAFEQRRINMLEKRMGAGRPAPAAPAKPPVQKVPVQKAP